MDKTHTEAPRPQQPAGCTPWWLRSLPVAHCSQIGSTEVPCKYYSLTSTVCRVEKLNGQNARKCERLLRKLRDCGRGLEEVNFEREETTEDNYCGNEASLPDPERLFRVSSSTASGEPLDANLGEAIEEFMHYANELKHHVAQEAPPVSQPLPPEYKQHWPRRNFLSRMFAREAECSPGRQRPSQKTWEEYSRDFQEV